MALAELMRFNEAEVELKTSIELQPTYFAFSNLGLIYYQQRRWGEAAEMWQAALKLNRSDFRVWSNLGVAYEWLGQRAKADDAFNHELTTLEPTAKLRPEDAALQCELGLLHSKRGLRSKAVSLVQAALARAPQDPGVLGCAGESYNNLGDQSQALVYIAQALEKGLPVREVELNPTLSKLLADTTLRKRIPERSMN